jgi:hypothetical protein
MYDAGRAGRRADVSQEDVEEMALHGACISF